MKLEKYFLMFLSLIFTLIITANVYANKASVAIDAPDSAVKGTEITIKLTITHSGNNFFHYTNWVYVKAGGKEIARWDFTRSNRPENEVFTRELKLTIDGPAVIEAQANCNVHGSAGIMTKNISVK